VCASRRAHWDRSSQSTFGYAVERHVGRCCLIRRCDRSWASWWGIRYVEESRAHVSRYLAHHNARLRLGIRVSPSVQRIIDHAYKFETYQRKDQAEYTYNDEHFDECEAAGAPEFFSTLHSNVPWGLGDGLGVTDGLAVGLGLGVGVGVGEQLLVHALVVGVGVGVGVGALPRPGTGVTK